MAIKSDRTQCIGGDIGSDNGTQGIHFWDQFIRKDNFGINYGNRRWLLH